MSVTRSATVLEVERVDQRIPKKQAKLEEIWERTAHAAALPHAPDSLAVKTLGLTLRQLQQLSELSAQIESRAEAVPADSLDLCAASEIARHRFRASRADDSP